ncbi:MauE/DoxX family redox-associated membrane protein [Sphingobacterium rhinopitheci]|uniref:MauE/DoxX family redox-associated membrane protein n=1 Tax=Sphingobacterium rhinopitheci TaxID=2781960 RepID=UPI001F52ACE4|nr:MauE/DoxX family redox-associated membrane protein [Sphingobacterium rhinopitheci]MCI0922407.1 hypothetical protein [Sphingobacterium rhinopitheci]
MKKPLYILQGITILLLILWIPTSLNKLLDFESFKQDINKQPFNIILAKVIIYSIPLLEILTVILIVIPKYRRLGFISSTFLMSIFTLYIASALLYVWDKLPCGCGLILSQLNWQEHLWFNLTFLLLSIAAWYLETVVNKNRISDKS